MLPKPSRLHLLIIGTLGIALWFTFNGWPTIARPLPARSLKPIFIPNFDPTPLQNIVQIAAGDFHMCVLTSSGGGQCWGPTNLGN